MKSRAIFIMIVFVLCGYLYPAGSKNIVVFPLENSTGSDKYEYLGVYLKELVTIDLLNNNIQVLERENLDEIIKEQKRSLTGALPEELTIKVGKIIGTDNIVTGGFVLSGTELKINIHIHDVETAKLLRSEEITGSLVEIVKLSGIIVKKLLNNTAANKENISNKVKTIDPRLSNVVRFYYSGEYDKAIFESMKIKEGDYSYYDSLFLRAECYFELKDYRHAMFDYERLLGITINSKIVQIVKEKINICMKNIPGTRIEAK